MFYEDDAAALVDEFSNEFLFSVPDLSPEASEGLDNDYNDNNLNTNKMKQPLAVPAWPAPVVPALTVPSLSALHCRARALTKAEIAKRYRAQVAIPRYLAKRARRVWTKELMHPSRSAAAMRRPRNGGQFGVVPTNFVPASALRGGEAGAKAAEA